jgi:Tol biopolymer transport system component
MPGADGAVYLMRVDDEYVKLLFEDVFFKSVLIPSPDGSFLAFPEYDPESGKNVLKIITPDGSTLRELATFSTSIYPIVWSPDGEYLAFGVYGVDPVMSADVYLIRQDGRDLKQVYQGEAAFFDFSPDGQYLLVDDTLQGRIFSVNLTTLETTLIQAPGLPLDWTWYGATWQRP